MAPVITFKPILKTAQPFPTMETYDYLLWLKKHSDSIFTGMKGIYLAEEVLVDGQRLYAPFIDIDGDSSLAGEDKIESSILNTQLTYTTLDNLGVSGRFTFIATGNTGFRALSNMLFEKSVFLAFIDFIKGEMPHINDTAPTEHYAMPQQLFAYKGSPLHNTKELVHRHSAVIAKHILKSKTLTRDLYKELTAGKPDPEEIIAFMDGYLEYRPVTDIDSLGKLGRFLKEYRDVRNDFTFKTFDFAKSRRKEPPLSLEILKKYLDERGTQCRIEIRHQLRKMAISFRGYPCPVCGKPTANAYAFPPHFTLKCFNTHCKAYTGMPLVHWAGIVPSSPLTHTFRSRQFALSPPSDFTSMEDVQQTIKDTLYNNEDTLYRCTPGTGKTYAASKCLAESPGDNMVLVSSYNIDLQREQYERFISLNKEKKAYLLKSRQAACSRKDELNTVVGNGYSPAEILCPRCNQLKDCEYYLQRQNKDNGVYFVTHQMLRYLESIFPEPRLLILDEEIARGFFLKDECTEADMRRLSAVFRNDRDFAVIEKILKIAHTVSISLTREKKRNSFLINAKILGDPTEATVLSSLAHMYKLTEHEMREKLLGLIAVLDAFTRNALYDLGVSLTAVHWLRGIISNGSFPYISFKNDGAVAFAVKYKTPLGFLKTPVKVLDATGDKRVIESLIGRRLNVVSLDAEWHGKRVHQKTSTGRYTLEHASMNDLKRMLRIGLKELSAQKIMVITYKKQKDRIIAVCRELDNKKEFKGYHFMGPRGINDYEDCDAVLVVGLPTPNMDNSCQDAHILFPEDEDLQDEWLVASMQWELVQNIHRIRPVRKKAVELVIITLYWPSILPPPTLIIDRSADRNWKISAIKRLDPYVKEFGLFNADIGILARIYQQGKLISAITFLREIVRHILFLFDTYPGETEDTVDTKNRLDSVLTKQNVETPGGEQSVAKLFSDIIYTYIKKELADEETCIHLIIQILRLWLNESSPNLLTDTPIIALTHKQWADLETHFREKYPHFESFKVRLPHASGNYVHGVGIKNKVIQFYNDLSEIDFFSKFSISSYTMRESSKIAIEPVPPGYIVVFIPEQKSTLVYIGYESEILVTTLHKAVSTIAEQSLSAPETVIVTNDGKHLIQSIIQTDSRRYNVADVLLNERLIGNGNLPATLNAQYLFDTYQLSSDIDSTTSVTHLFTVWERQKELIEKNGLHNIARLENEIMWIISGMEVDGIGFDDEAFKWRYDEMVMDKGLRGDRLYTDTHASINLEDPQSVEEYISNTSMNEEWKEELRGLYGEYRAIVSETESLAQFYQNVSSGRFHNEINQLGSVTGRLSTKLDHIPKKGPLRSYIKAPEGYTFIIADYKNQETRIIYGLSHDTKGIETLERGKDIFIETAALVTGKPESECSHLRDIFKLFVNSVHNGAHAYGIRQMFANAHKDVTVEQANEFIEAYFKQHPDVKSWMEKTKEKAREDGYAQTVMGRRLIVFTEQDGTKDSSIYNFPIQGNGADGLKLAMVLLNKRLQGKDARIVLTLHDEIIVETNNDIAEEVRQVVKEVMVEAFTKLVPDVPFDVKLDIRNTWGKLNDPVDPENNV